MKMRLPLTDAEMDELERAITDRLAQIASYADRVALEDVFVRLRAARKIGIESMPVSTHMTYNQVQGVVRAVIALREVQPGDVNSALDAESGAELLTLLERIRAKQQLRVNNERID